MHRAARSAKTGFHRNKQPNRTDGESAENSEEKAFWMLTCSAHNLWAAVPHQWYESGIFERCHLLTSPLNRQLGRGREVGRPPSFCRQISELDRVWWCVRPTSAGTTCLKPFPRFYLPPPPKQQTYLLPMQDDLLGIIHMLTSLVILLQNIQFEITFGDWLSARLCKHTIRFISLFLPDRIRNIHKYMFTQTHWPS